MLGINAVHVGSGSDFATGAQSVIAAIRRFMPLPAVLKVVRGGGLRMRLGRATVMIDGIDGGELAAGGSNEYPLSPGTHELIVTATTMALRTATAPIRVDVGAGETVVVDVAPGARGWVLTVRAT